MTVYKKKKLPLLGFLILVLLSCTPAWPYGHTGDEDQRSSPPITDARDPNVYVGPRVSDRPFLKKFAANVLLDQKSIWASPLQVDRSSAKWWIAAGVGTAALLAADHTVKDSTGARRDPGQLRSLGHRCILGGTASEINKGRIARFGRQRDDLHAICSWRLS